MQALRQIYAVFKADMEPLKKGLKEGDKQVSTFEKSLKGLIGPLAAVFAGGAVASFTKDLIHSADATAKMADSLGLGIVELQEWQHATDLSGVQQEAFNAILGKTQLQLNEVATKGTGPAAEALKVLGIEAETADGKLKNAGDVIMEVADAIQGLDVTERNAQLMKLFGEQGAKLVPLLKGGSAGIRAMREEVAALGFAFDEDFARNAEAFDDNIDKLGKGFKGLVIQGLGPLLPDLVAFTQQIVEGTKAVIPMVKGMVRFVRETKLLEAAATVLASGGLLYVNKHIATWGKSLAKWLKTMGGVRGVLARVVPWIWKVIAPMLILEDLFVFFSGGDSAIGRTLDKAFGEGTADKVRELAGEVVDFVKMFKTAPGDVRRAFEDLPGDLKAIMGPFGEFVGELSQNLAEYFLFAVDLMTGGWKNFADKSLAVGDGMLLALNAIWTEVKFTGLGVAASLSDGFMNAWNAIIGGAQAALRAIADVTSNLPFLGDAADGVRQLAGKVGGYKGEANASEAVREQMSLAKLALASDYDNVRDRVTARPSSSSSVSQTVQNTTEVNVTVPSGTPASLASRVGRAAAQGAERGSRSNRRATQAALVPRPAG